MSSELDQPKISILGNDRQELVVDHTSDGQASYRRGEERSDEPRRSLACPSDVWSTTNLSLSRHRLILRSHWIQSPKSTSCHVTVIASTSSLLFFRARRAVACQWHVIMSLSSIVSSSLARHRHRHSRSRFWLDFRLFTFRFVIVSSSVSMSMSCQCHVMSCHVITRSIRLRLFDRLWHRNKLDQLKSFLAACKDRSYFLDRLRL